MKLDDARVRESSGLAMSLRHPDVAWTLNDSGGKPAIYAVNLLTGKVICEVTIAGAKNVDWEAIGLGYSTDGTPVIYVADCGDNGWKRQNIQILQITEPKTLKNQTAPLRHGKPFDITYPDGPRDCEAMVVDQSVDAGRVYLLTKVAGKSTGAAYRLPYVASGKAVRVGEVGQWLTDAALRSDAKLLLSRSQDHGFAHEWPSLKLIKRFKFEHQAQGEGMTFSKSGQSIWLSTEGIGELVKQNVAELLK